MHKVIQHDGFTLLEIMVTLFILMIVGTLISSGLHTVLTAQDRIQKKRYSLTEIQLALFQINLDMQQLMNKPILNPQGQELPVIIQGNNFLEFTRGGFINSSIVNPDTFERITYKLIDTHLLRITQHISNNKVINQSDSELLLSHVKAFEARLIPANNPLSNISSQNKTILPNQTMRLGIDIKITSSEFGNIHRIVAFEFNTLDKENNDSSS